MNETMTSAAPEKEIAGMDLKLDASVRPISPKNNLLAFASLRVADCLVINNIKIVAGEKGLMVDMPSAQDANGRYHNIAHPITSEFHERVKGVVLEKYAAALEKLKDISQAHDEKWPLAERLAAGKAKAAEHVAPVRTAPARAAEAVI